MARYDGDVLEMFCVSGIGHSLSPEFTMVSSIRY